MSEAKPYCITRQEVWDAYEKVKENQGGAGVDGQTIADFERELKNNLYKIWNRMSSGSYFPPPVLTVEIPKESGGKRKLGIPTVGDRIAQAVVKVRLEKELEPIFHEDSYGYRPGRSAGDALAKTRERCWKHDWVIDLDIKGFFDNIDHDLLMQQVLRHAPEQWMILYIKRWLTAPAQDGEGQLTERCKGTPQGGVISPLLANLFLHYVFDAWMAEEYPSLPFERYADDVIVHCRSEKQAKMVVDKIKARLKRYRLELHPEKTKIVYCKDANRREEYPTVKFDYLGYTFRARRTKSRAGAIYAGFNPAISKEARKSIQAEMRSWKLSRRTGTTLEDFARKYNPIIRGWIEYYGKFFISELYSSMGLINQALVRWAVRKYKKLRRSYRRGRIRMRRIARQNPTLFAHWRLVTP